jgi:parvulin-like peptidyl-prolyl isomerase
MVNEKKSVETPQEESDVEWLNNLVANSEDNVPDEVSETVSDQSDEKIEDTDKKSLKEDVEDIKKDDAGKGREEIKQEHPKKPAIPHPKQHYEKRDAKPKKEEIIEIKKVEHKTYTEHKHNHKEDKSAHQKKPEIKKEEKIDAKKPKEVITMKKAKQSKVDENREHKRKSKLTKNVLIWIGIVMLAAILVTAIILLVSPKNKVITEGNQTIKSVAATVNGEAIYLQDIQTQYDSLNPMIKQMYTLESILNKSIDDILLKQEAKNMGITVNEKEVQTEIDAVKEQNKLTDEQFEQALTQQGMTLKGVEDMIRDNILIKKFLNSTILNNLTITENNIEAYYSLNIEKFNAPEQVTVQHILIMITPNVTDAQAKSKIEQIQKEFNGSNFCELVTKYSEDPGSLSTCGKYTFAKGDFNNPEFENPSFDLKVGENAIIQTSFGYHLINKLASIPARVLNLTEVHDNINTTLYDETAQKRFDALMAGLRDKAVIINYMTKTEGNESVLIPLEETVTNLDDFAKCLTEKGTVFYGASWCTHCNNQKKMFGESLQYINYTECADEMQGQTKACDDAGISGYPTWIINGQSYPGEQTLDRLAKLSGCELPE